MMQRSLTELPRIVIPCSSIVTTGNAINRVTGSIVVLLKNQQSLTAACFTFCIGIANFRIGYLFGFEAF